MALTTMLPTSSPAVMVKYSFHWNVSMGLIVSLFTELRSFSGGRIPFTPMPRRADPKCIRPENFPLRSTRSGDTGPGTVDEYLGSWDASDPSCISHLMKLVSALRCENSFIPTEGVTEARRVVANAMRRSPSIHVMMLRTEVGMSNMFQDLMEHFAEQVWYDPLTDIFNDPAEQTIAEKNVKKESEHRKFQAAAVYTAETWLDCTIRAGVSALEEHRYRSDNHTHSAQAVILPIKETWFPGEGYHLAFAVVAKLDESSKRKPFPQEGDRLVVTIRISSTRCELISRSSCAQSQLNFLDLVSTIPDTQSAMCSKRIPDISIKHVGVTTCDSDALYGDDSQD
jgi:hypothetical protein